MPPKKKPALSGYCGMGQHEGTKPRNWRNQPLPTCRSLGTCGCKCHERMSEMFKLAGKDRILVENPEYVPDRGNFVIPDPIDVRLDDGRSNPNGLDDPVTYERPPTGVLDPVAGVTFELTPTGRKARGQLEFQVLAICRRWLAKEFDWPGCYPKYIAEAIDSNDPPSTGAVTAVLDRWVNLEYAEYSKKPIQFIRFLDGYTGTPEELARVKAERKRSIKHARSAQRRGIR